MTKEEHDNLIKLARKVKMPRYMYDTPSAREALNRLAAILAMPSYPETGAGVVAYRPSTREER